MINNILCIYEEYKKVNGRWIKAVESSSYVNEIFIQNILDSSYYFTSMGGTQDIKMKRNRRFGMQVSEITCISFCGKIRKRFSFSFNNAREVVQSIV